jgi:hypothetical protein
MEGCTELSYSADPTTTYFVKDGFIVAKRTVVGDALNRVENWYKVDKLHRLGDLPAVTYYQNGQIVNEQWHQEGQIHRLGDQPAMVRYKDGKKIQEEWYKNGALHRDGGQPASIHYNNGQVAKKQWYKYGRIHTPAPPTIEGELAKIRRRAVKTEASVAVILAMLTK